MRTPANQRIRLTIAIATVNRPACFLCGHRGGLLDLDLVIPLSVNFQAGMRSQAFCSHAAEADSTSIGAAAGTVQDLNSRWAGSWLSDRSESAGLKKVT
jgi:hypothetical protein